MTERKKQIYQLIAVSTVLLLILLMTVFAPWIAPYDPTAVNMEHRLLAPCQAHPLGTDALGRDVLSRVIYGGRASLLLAVIATCCSMGLGLAIGIAAGYCEGITDTIITGISNVFQGLPSTILMIALVGILGSNNYSIVFALVLTSWVGFSRLVRGEVLKVKQEPYIESMYGFGQVIGTLSGSISCPISAPISLCCLPPASDGSCCQLQGSAIWGLGFSRRPPTGEK